MGKAPGKGDAHDPNARGWERYTIEAARHDAACLWADEVRAALDEVLSDPRKMTRERLGRVGAALDALVGPSEPEPDVVRAAAVVRDAIEAMSVHGADPDKIACTCIVKLQAIDSRFAAPVDDVLSAIRRYHRGPSRASSKGKISMAGVLYELAYRTRALDASGDRGVVTDRIGQQLRRWARNKRRRRIA